MIETASWHLDAQGAIGMETRMGGVTTAVLGRPRYVDGGQPLTSVPDEAEVVVMQGPLEYLRASPGAQVGLLERAIREHHEQARVAAGRRANASRRAGLCPLRAAQAALLDMALTRAAEVGALASLASLVVLEDRTGRALRSRNVRDLCARHGATHRYARELLGPTGPAWIRAVAGALGELAEALPDVEWFLRIDADVLLVRDAWEHVAVRGQELGADVCANVAADGRFDPTGYMLPCAAFSSATCRELAALVSDPRWRLVEPLLEGADDLDLTPLVRLLGRRLMAPEGRRGLCSVRELLDPKDEAVWRAKDAGEALAIHVGGRADKEPRMREALARLHGEERSRRTTFSRRRLGPVEVVSWSVGRGSFTTDGSLGYDGGTCPVPRACVGLADALLLSAHGPSRVEIDVHEPIDLFGFLNGSARFDPRNPVEFWVDWNFIGDVAMPGRVSTTRRLEPGRHLLVVSCAEAESRHTLWALRPAPPAPAVAEPEIAVLTIAAYPEHMIPAQLGLFARSALKRGVPFQVCFPGESYAGHTEMKIRRLRPVIEALRARRVLFTDGRDCLFMADLPRILRQFDSMRTPVIASVEKVAWPITDRAWADRFPRHPSGCNWINAGQWMGEREPLLRTLAVLEDLDARSKQPPAPGEHPDLDLCRRAPGDDQLLWQMAHVNRLADVVPDYEGRVFRNVFTLDMQLVANRDFDIGADELVSRQSGQRPCVVHFSGWGAGYCMHQWGAALDAY